MGLFSRNTKPPPVVNAVELNNGAPPIVRISNITVAEAQRLSENNANILVKLERPSASNANKNGTAASELAGIHAHHPSRVSHEKNQTDIVAAKSANPFNVQQLWEVAAVATAVDASSKRFSRESQIQKALEDAANAAAAVTSGTPAADSAVLSVAPPKRSSRETQAIEQAVRKSRESQQQAGPRFDADAVAAAIHAAPPVTAQIVEKRTSRYSQQLPVVGNLLPAGNVPRSSLKRESVNSQSAAKTAAGGDAPIRTSTTTRSSRNSQTEKPVETRSNRANRPYIPIHLLQPTTGEIEQERALRLKTAREADERAKTDIRRRSIEILRKCDFLCINAGNAGRHTVLQLGEQTERLERMIGGLDEIGRDLGEAEQNLGSLTTWCCGLFTKRNDDGILGPEDEAELNAIDALKTLKSGGGDAKNDDDDSDSDDDIMAAARQQQKISGGPLGSKQQQVLGKLAKASQQHHLKHHKSHKVKIIRDTATANISDPLELEVCDTLMNLFVQVDHLELETKTMNEALQAREDQINRAVGKVERNVTRLQGAIKHGQSLLQ